jgi:general stress protein 26
VTQPKPSGSEQRVLIDRLLAAARNTIAEVPYCWVVTPAEAGGANARVVKAFPAAAGDEPMTCWFLTRRISRKSAEIAHAGRVTLAYQHDSGRAYVTVSGRAELVDDRLEIETRLRRVESMDIALAAILLAVRVIPDRIEVHVRGVTAEPWGQGRTLLEQNAKGEWSLQVS